MQCNLGWFGMLYYFSEQNIKLILKTIEKVAENVVHMLVTVSQLCSTQQRNIVSVSVLCRRQKQIS